MRAFPGWTLILTLSGIGHVSLALASGPISAPRRDRYEPAIFPVVAGDTDVGVKLGGFAQLARFWEDARPYAWRAQLFAAISVLGVGDAVEFPYREGYFRLDWPHALASAARVLADISYLQTTNLGYYGLGNASAARPLWQDFPEGSAEYTAARHKYQFDGKTLMTRATAMVPFAQAWRVYLGAGVQATLTDLYAGSLLDEHLASGPGGGERLFGVDDHWGIISSWGVVYDTRNHETVPTSGAHHELAFRFNPGAFGSDVYLGGTLTLRAWIAPFGERLTIGARLLGDALTGHAPLSELGQYGGLYGSFGPAGSRGIRGVPQGRLLGRTKVIANLEIQSLLLPFEIFSQPLTLGLAAFADAGRVWTDTLQANAELDGQGLGIHWGVGGGPRLRWGDVMIIRCDFAYAPLGAELGDVPAVYVDVDPVF
jgi:hypothetical protein